MLDVILMCFCMVNNIMSMLVGESEYHICTIKGAISQVTVSRNGLIEKVNAHWWHT